MPELLPLKHEMMRLGPNDRGYWDGVRTVRVDGHRLERRWVRLGPEHVRWQTYGLGKIGKHDIGRVLVVDRDLDGGAGQGTVDIIQDEPPFAASSVKERTVRAATNDQQYERRSLDEAMRHEREVEGASLTDRKEAKAGFLEAMKDPALVAERVSWLLDGNYGKGEMMRARQVLASPRMNRRAALTHLVGIYEWMCPVKMGIDAWKTLSAAQKAALDAALDIAIAHAEEALVEEG